MLDVVTCKTKIHSFQNIPLITKRGLSSDSCHVSLPYITRALDPARTLEYALAARPSSLQTGAASCSALCSAMLQAVSDIGLAEGHTLS